MISEDQPGSTDRVPPWLEPDNDSIPPAPLQAIYGKLDPAVTQVCERARRSMRDAYLHGLATVRDALAPSGLFKEWCQAAGINYSTVSNRLSLAERKQAVTKSVTVPLVEETSEEEAEAEEEAEEEVRHDDTKDAKRPKQSKAERYAKKRVYELKLAFGTAEQYDRVTHGLQRVITAYPEITSREAALVLVLDVYEGRTLAVA